MLQITSDISLENTLTCFNYGCDTRMFIRSAGIYN